MEKPSKTFVLDMLFAFLFLILPSFKIQHNSMHKIKGQAAMKGKQKTFYRQLQLFTNLLPYILFKTDIFI